MKITAFSLVLASMTCLANHGQAALVTITNSSFETSSSAATGWNTTGAGGNASGAAGGGYGIAVRTVDPLTDPVTSRQVNAGVFGGTQNALRLYTFYPATTRTQSFISQDTLTMSLASYTYTFSVNIASIAGGPSPNTTNNYSGFDITLSAGANFNYRVYTTATSSYAVTATPTGSNILSASYNLTGGTANLGINAYTTLTMTVTTTSALTDAGNLVVRLSSGDRNLNNSSTIFDQVSLDATAVPEPSVIGAVSLAGMAFAAYHMRRRNRSIR